MRGISGAVYGGEDETVFGGVKELRMAADVENDCMSAEGPDRLVDAADSAAAGACGTLCVGVCCSVSVFIVFLPCQML